MVSYYDKNHKLSDNKYRLRSNLGAGQIKAIFLACLEAFRRLEGMHAMVFHASNDVGKIQEDNSRFSAYKLFLNYNIENYGRDYLQKGSIQLNTLMFYHKDFLYKKEADDFFEEFSLNIDREIEEEKKRID